MWTGFSNSQLYTCFRLPSACLASPAAPCSGPAPEPDTSFAAPAALSAAPLACWCREGSFSLLPSYWTAHPASKYGICQQQLLHQETALPVRRVMQVPCNMLK
jgi:hypothetical protein